MSAHLDAPQTGPSLYSAAKKRIPGGTQLLSKRPEMFLPDQWPAYYEKAEGCLVTDLDGRSFIDFTSCGIGSCLLGYADPVVNAAVIDRIQRGSMCTLNSPEEVELADRLCQIHPWAERVRFARTGGESLSIAVRIARAHTGRDRIAVCGYHGWSDWYLAANLGATDALGGHLLPGLEAAGVPSVLRGTTLPFRYNRIAELEAIVTANRGEIAAIVMEPMRHAPPEDDFLDRVRALATEAGAVLVFDEVTAGWRSHFGGMHLKLGVHPDLAVFAKSLSNGFPMAAIIGRATQMESAQRAFISSTYWTEGTGPTAALATISRLEELDAPAHIDRIGKMTMEGLRKAGFAHGVPVSVHGLPALIIFAFDHGEESRAVMTLFTQEMLERGFLANGSFYPTCAHTPREVNLYLEAVNDVFKILRLRIDSKAVRSSLRGPVAHSGFARLT